MSSLEHLAYLAGVGCVALAAAGACFRTAEAPFSLGWGSRRVLSGIATRAQVWLTCVAKYPIPMKHLDFERIGAAHLL